MVSNDFDSKKKEGSNRSLILDRILTGMVIDGMKIKSVKDIYSTKFKSNGFMYMGYDDSDRYDKNRRFTAIYPLDITSLSDVGKMEKAIESYNKTFSEYNNNSYYGIFIMFDKNDNVIYNIKDSNLPYYTFEDISNELDRYNETIKEFNIFNETTIEETDLSSLRMNETRCRQVWTKLKENTTIYELFDKEFGGIHQIGNRAELYETLNPDSPYTFFQLGETYADLHTHLFVVNKGVTKEDIIERVHRFHKRINEVMGGNNPFTKEELVYVFLHRCYVIPFDGFYAEKNYKDIMISKGLGTIEKTEKEYDKNYGIDLILNENDNETTHFIQIKPYSFLGKLNYSDYYDSLVKKYNNFLNSNYKCKTEYAFYVMDELNKTFSWVKSPNNDMYLFSLDDIKQREKKIDVKELETIKL